MRRKRVNTNSIRLNADAAAQGFVRIPYHADFNFAQAGDTEKPFSISLWVWPENVLTTGHPIISRFDAYGTSDQGPSNQKQTWRLIFVGGVARGAGPTSGGAPITQNGVHPNPWSSEAVPNFAMSFLLHDFANSGGDGVADYNARNRLRISTKTAIGAAGNHERWHHIVITYDGSKTRAGLKIYVNGEDDTIENDFLRVNNADPATYLGEAGFKGMDPTDQSDIVIGGYHDFKAAASVSSQLGERYVADTCLFNKALSPAEVREIYGGTPGVQGTGKVADMTKVSTYNDLISWWKMGDDEDGPGASQIKDYVSGHHGTLSADASIEYTTDLETDFVTLTDNHIYTSFGRTRTPKGINRDGTRLSQVTWGIYQDVVKRFNPDYAIPSSTYYVDGNVYKTINGVDTLVSYSTENQRYLHITADLTNYSRSSILVVPWYWYSGNQVFIRFADTHNIIPAAHSTGDRGGQAESTRANRPGIRSVSAIDFTEDIALLPATKGEVNSRTIELYGADKVFFQVFSSEGVGGIDNVAGSAEDDIIIFASVNTF